MAHALLRAESTLVSTPGVPGRRSVEKNLDAARRSARATAEPVGLEMGTKSTSGRLLKSINRVRQLLPELHPIACSEKRIVIFGLQVERGHARSDQTFGGLGLRRPRFGFHQAGRG